MTASTQTKKIGEKLLKSIYGEFPPHPVHLSHKNKCINEVYIAGKAIYKEEKIILDLGDKEEVLLIKVVIPKSKLPCPVIIYLSDKGDIPNRFLPLEEIIDRGYGIISVCIDDVAENNGDFKSKICGKIARSRKKKDASGKISVWGWALMRAVDYVSDAEDIDKDTIILAGHGIFSRATMLAGAFDERVKYVIANGIGSYPPTYCVKRAQNGMTVKDFPYLYCPAFVNEPSGDELYALLCGCKDKQVLIGSAEDGYSNHLDEISCIYSVESEHSEKKEKEIPTAPMRINVGSIYYHLRSGTDYFSREDWNIYLDFIDEKIGKKQIIDNNCLHFS